MGLKDSSATRVAPIFTRLLMRDPTGQSWLRTLLDLPRRDGDRVAVEDAGHLLRCAWWPEEKQLPPPATLLAHLVKRDPQEVPGEDLRSRLLRGDAQARATAVEVLGRRSLDSLEKGWAILEGPTSVDAYLETANLIVVVEGKRAEAGPTTKTTFMPVRHQMLRAIDAAWDGRGTRDVVGFFIVDRDAPGYARTTLDPSAITGSLPHRSFEEQQRIARAFLGATTWDEVCAEFDIDVRLLPDTIAINRAT